MAINTEGGGRSGAVQSTSSAGTDDSTINVGGMRPLSLRPSVR